MDAAFERYRFARDQKIGRKLPCAYCGERFTKKTQAHAFCSNKGPGNCKDAFWSMKDEFGVHMRDVANRVITKRTKAAKAGTDARVVFIQGMIPNATRKELIQIARILGYEGEETNGSSSESS